MTDTADGCLGIVLRTTPLRESDLVVTLYTDTHGRISALARGARRSQRRFAGTLSLMVLGRYRLGAPRGDLWTIEAAEVVREWTSVAMDVLAVAHASYVAEVIGGLLPEGVPDPLALDLMVDLWNTLASGGPSPGALRAVELALLDIGGHRPAIDACAACGETELDRGVVFDPVRGGAVCRRCAATSRGPSVRAFTPATRAYLRAVLELESPSAARAVDDDPRFLLADKKAARDALVAMVTSLVGRPLRSLEYLAKLGAAGHRTGPGP